MAEKLDDKFLKKVERATTACPVKRSLNEKIVIETIFKGLGKITNSTDGPKAKL